MRWIRSAMGQSCRWGSFVHFLQQSFEAIESVAPEDGIVLDPIDQGGQTFPVSSVVGLASFPSVANQLGLLEHTQVLRDRGLRHPRALRQRAHGLLAVADYVLVDRATGRV